VNVWIPLETWGQYNGISNMTQHGPNQTAAFDLQTSNGVMSLKIGGKVARCNGLECWLAYAPQMIKGRPYIYSLDAQKNLQPFVAPAAYQFTTNRTIVLDPGHGGKDSGAKDINRSNFEKEYTLDWAIRVARLLATNGWRVVMTRTTDIDVSLGERVAMANRAKGDLFLSLHFNSGTPNRELTGVETYCVTPTGMPSSLVRTYEDDKKQIFPNNAFDEQNYQIGYRLHRELVQSLGAIDRGLRRARFMTVLRGQHRPAVLIEGGYLSNPAEARKIATTDYREKLAEAVARALD
jgi:N-acetylmuramoyl-L-alanine amidase